MDPYRLNHRDVLRFIAWFIAERGYSPTVREIAMWARRSPSTIEYHLRVLRDRGDIGWAEGKPRTIRVSEREEVG